MLYSGLSLGTKHTIVFKLNVISGQLTLKIPHDLSELVLWYLRCMLLLQVNMSMRRPRDQNSSKLAVSRSRVIDFKDGYMMGDDAEEHLPVGAMPIEHSGTDIQSTSGWWEKVKELKDKAVAKAKEKAKEIKEMVDKHVKNARGNPPEVKKAQEDLDQMSHHIATNIMELVDSDVDVFADKYLSAFPPDSITQQQLDTMLSLGKDVFNTSLCKHVKLNIGADFRQTKKMNMYASTQHERRGGGDRRHQTSMVEDGEDSPYDTEHDQNTRPIHPDPANHPGRAKDQIRPDDGNSRTAPDTEAKYSINDMQPRLKKAVTETLDAYGIKENGIIDTKKLARVYQLQSMLRA